MKAVNRYIRFEVETRMAPLGIFGGLGEDTVINKDVDNEYQEATEEDIMAFARALGGG
ncbi:hypothetical protein E308F_30050 [Moorella sp. E308F]|nr:hypothetical protein E308F_30050 [Moorella sp. E308F]